MTSSSTRLDAVRFGLIGLGAAGCKHLEVLANMPEVEVVGIADLNAEYVEQLGAEYAIPLATTDHRRLLADPSIAAIAIAAADAAHYPLVLDCAAARKHVACEKPIATEVVHGREMVAAMENAGRLFCVTFNNRASAITRRIKELVDAGAVGNVRRVRLLGLMAPPDNRWLRDQRGDEAARARVESICVQGKNALYDCGVHSFDFARFLTGSEFKRIDARGWAMRGFPYPDHGVALCEHDNGIFTLIEKGFDYAYEAQTRKEYVRYEVLGDGGSLAWDLDTNRLRVFGREQTLDELLPHGGKGDVRETLYRGFVESLRAGELLTWLASGYEGLKAIEAAQAATDSMLANGVVHRDIGNARNWFDAAT
ncbi:MAG: Gfo/Idh/MocA family oxidoreductase [Armatimonadetes bacterium]|nr:Gfo/Idh/MocA family oxidoreductase [Armatimonadota bacterium]NCP29286.1 Gfo/Idh/MocA family oxidoreductase [Armatimonadota bacterium]NCQ31660.1 Gfo/Idh/MocA family oxidoreductase [Armatimonadota bacterium]